MLGFWAQFRVSSAFNRYKKIAINSGLTGAEVAQKILQEAGLQEVSILPAEGMMSDHYDPSKKCLHLSTDVFYGNSITSAGVAAHECGHALQHQAAYAPLKLRMFLVPATQFSSRLLPFIILGGFFFHMTNLITLGIACYAVLAVFQLVTLPVEFDASARAKVILKNRGIIHSTGEIEGVNAVLNAAAWTYIAAFVATVGNLLYLLMIRRDER